MTQEKHPPKTLRDEFAIAAMHQFLAGTSLPPSYDASQEFAMLADRAYEMADAMLSAREATGESPTA